MNGGDVDAHGNMTSLGSTATPLRFSYDSSDRNTAIVQRDSNGTGIATYYTRDVSGRIVMRETDTITNWTWNQTSKNYFGFSGSSDTPDFVKDAAGNITEKYLRLAGGVNLTIRPSAPQVNDQYTYSLRNIHGDVFATSSTVGTVLGTTMTGPFGELIAGQSIPNNTVSGTTSSYVGRAQKLTESNFSLQLMQMGARVYLPSIGRFVQVDPVEGGTANAYVYATNPVNEYDLTGTIGYKKWFKDRWSNVKSAWNHVKNNPADSASALPVIGAPLDAYTFARDLRRGDKMGAGLSAVGFIPVVGDTGKGTGKVARVAREIPGKTLYRGADAATDAYKHLEKCHGVDQYTASTRLHNIKESAGLRPNDNVVIGATGDVYNELTGDFLGTLTGPTY